MAASRAHCDNCGEPFDRRAVTQSFCFKDDCRAARNRKNVRAHRQTRAHLTEWRWQKNRRAA